MIYFYIGLAGALGAICRFLVAIIITPFNNSVFPYETLVVNLAGSFALSFLTFLSLSRWRQKENLRLAVTTGFIGSFTTFSTFSLELVNLLKYQQYILALLYVAISLVGGLLLAWAGMYLAEYICKKFTSVESQ